MLKIYSSNLICVNKRYLSEKKHENYPHYKRYLTAYLQYFYRLRKKDKREKTRMSIYSRIAMENETILNNIVLKLKSLDLPKFVTQ
jgi:hypothetical protein